jgi:hypothetical protein
MIIGDTTTWSIAHDHHSDDSRGVIYDHNIFNSIIIIIMRDDCTLNECRSVNR